MNVLSTMEVVNKSVLMVWVLTAVIVIMDIILTWTIILVMVSYINNTNKICYIFYIKYL